MTTGTSYPLPFRGGACPSHRDQPPLRGPIPTPLQGTDSHRVSSPIFPTVLIGWALAALVLLLVSAQRIATLGFPDPDDAMRLAEVRDLVAGQGWWDVAQHRLNGGDFAMHWSRLVDLPLAAVMLVCDPLFGPAISTRIAMAVVPLLTLLVVMALGALFTRRVAGREPVAQAVLLAALSVPLVYQLEPMRIDHHGWQIAAALAAAVALVGRPDARSGAIAGAALALLVTISLEGLPITVAMTGVALLGWALDPARRGQALALPGTLTGAVVALHVATRGPGLLAPACDAIAPAWIAALGVTSLLAAGTILAAPATPARRIAALAVAGIVGLATLRLAAPTCFAGPFATLDPLVRTIWYENVLEGMPVWRQEPARAAMAIGFPIAGLVGGVLAWRESDGAARVRWTICLALAGFAFALSLLVMRTGATANALALPGGAWLLLRLLTRARAVPNPALRTLATAAAFLAATPGLAASGLLGLRAPAAGAAASPATTGPAPCDPARDIPKLAALPAATLFAPIDITPAILATTPHRAIAGGYHRNSAAMHRVLAGFLASPEAAREIVAQAGADYVVGCPGENETDLLAHRAPGGLWARLQRGERVVWLAPVAIPGARILVWRVLGRSHPAKQRLS